MHFPLQTTGAISFTISIPVVNSVRDKWNTTTRTGTQVKHNNENRNTLCRTGTQQNASGGQSERLRNATRTQVEHNWNQVEHKLNIAKRAEPQLGQ